MGMIIAKFRRKADTIEVLEKIDKKISELQKVGWRTQQLQTQFIGSLILYSIIIYVLGALVFFFYYFPPTWTLRLLYSTPLLLFPIIVWLIKKFLHWLFVKRIANNNMKLSDLRGEKRKILDDVMETETYKKAKEILEKFDPERFKKLEPTETPKPTPMVVDTGLRQRVTASLRPTTPGIRPNRPPTPQSTPLSSRSTSSITPGVRVPVTPLHRNGTPSIVPSGPPLPRPVLPRQRGNVEKLVDYLVGDGPQSRYALICRQCHSHNGMALMEEFEYLSFRCCYCFSLNPARKHRPNAPRIEGLTPSLSNTTLPPAQRGSQQSLHTPTVSEDEADMSVDEESDGEEPKQLPEEPNKDQRNLQTHTEDEEEADMSVDEESDGEEPKQLPEEPNEEQRTPQTDVHQDNTSQVITTDDHPSTDT